MSRFTIAALLMAALSAAACSNDTTTSPTTTTPTPTSVTDSFNGTITKNGASSFAFNVSAAGAVYATLTSIADTSVPVGLSIGVWTAATATCSFNPSIANDSALQGSTLSASASGVGQLCVRVYDIGKVVNPLDYQVTVVHY